MSSYSRAGLRRVGCRGAARVYAFTRAGAGAGAGAAASWGRSDQQAHMSWGSRASGVCMRSGGSFTSTCHSERWYVTHGASVPTWALARVRDPTRLARITITQTGPAQLPPAIPDPGVHASADAAQNSSWAGRAGRWLAPGGVGCFTFISRPSPPRRTHRPSCAALSESAVRGPRFHLCD